MQSFWWHSSFSVQWQFICGSNLIWQHGIKSFCKTPPPSSFSSIIHPPSKIGQVSSSPPPHLYLFLSLSLHPDRERRRTRSVAVIPPFLLSSTWPVWWELTADHSVPPQKRRMGRWSLSSPLSRCKLVSFTMREKKRIGKNGEGGYLK